MSRNTFGFKQRPALLLGLTVLVLQMLGWSAQAQVENGQRFKDWMGRCETGKDDQGKELQVCYISQRLIMKEGKRPVLEVSVGYMQNDKQPAAFFTVPLGVTLPPGMQIQVDEQKAVRIPFAYCRDSGCIAPMPLNDDIVGQFKAGNKATITFIDGLGQRVPVPVSLSGFTAGFNALKP
ncbi:MAG: invasion associated locus B family protein [Gammaproteobacteria bacterium]|nr:invasion associated locus B family protein [Gammaproteobacteria bacterium]MCB2041166.1 invasion associated locus B family protein [Rhodoferax sp.]